MKDILTEIKDKTINCLDKGFVKLIDVMPRLVPEDKTCDYAICEMARVSYSGAKTVSDDKTLIRHLMRHGHTSPLEAVEFKFHLRLPIFVARQWQRHRSASAAEISGRYVKLNDEFYIPEIDNVRKQSDANKQGGNEILEKEIASDFISDANRLSNEVYHYYKKYLEQGMSREQARMMLPLNLYTEFYWKQDLHNLLHLLALRCDSHAQQETRVFANAILELITPLVPVTIEAWNDYHPMRGAIKLTRLEVEALRKYLNSLDIVWADSDKLNIKSDNKRECNEWNEKFDLLWNGITKH